MTLDQEGGLEVENDESIVQIDEEEDSEEEGQAPVVPANLEGVDPNIRLLLQHYAADRARAEKKEKSQRKEILNQKKEFEQKLKEMEVVIASQGMFVMGKGIL